jgi:hypothetical protein
MYNSGGYIPGSHGNGFVIPSQYDKEVYNWTGDVCDSIDYYLEDVLVFSKTFTYDGNGNISEIEIRTR